MRSALIAIACFATLTATASAQCGCGDCLADRVDAVRAWEIATFEQRLYQRVDQPTRVRSLYAEIEYARAREEALRRQLIEYRPFTRFRQGSPLNVTIERTKLELLREQQHLRDLRDRLANENRHHAERLRLHQLRVEQAAARLARLNAVGEEPHIEIVSH